MSDSNEKTEDGWTWISTIYLLCRECYFPLCSVYLNEYTPFEKTVDIRLVAAGNRDLQ